MCIRRSERNVVSLEPVFKGNLADSSGSKLRTCTDPACDNVYIQDTLALFTYYTKTGLVGLKKLYKLYENSKYYKILNRTSQPAHVVMLAAVSIIALSLTPSEKVEETRRSPILNLIYLSSFSMHLGVQVWMTFVSGLALYFTLPRHTFGQVQKVLFPKYFLINAIFSLITLTIFLKINRSQLTQTRVAAQAVAITVCFLIELLTRLYLACPMVKLMAVKYETERTAGLGSEVGQFDVGDLLNKPDYVNLNKTFRKLHSAAAMGNMIALGCSVFHLYYLSEKLILL